MWANFILVVFVIGMMAFWAYQGTFSSFMHCMLVIISGLLALAFWEPVAHIMLGTGRVATQFAWGVSLLLLFLVLLVSLRFLLDYYVPGAIFFYHPLNLAGGAVFGLCSALLTAGLVLIGLSYIPMGADVGGYQRYVVNSYGQAERSGSNGLAMPVDAIASNFFGRLTRGAYHPLFSRNALGTMDPSLVERAGQFRLAQLYDRFSSLIAAPANVKVENVMVAPTPLDRFGLDGAAIASLAPPLQDAIREPGYQLLLIKLEWNNQTAGTYDPDGTLRVPPVQIRLIGSGLEDPRLDWDTAQPIGVSYTTAGQEWRSFKAINSNMVSAYGTLSENTQIWAFLVPSAAQIDGLWARHLRLPLPDKQLVDSGSDATDLRQALGVSINDPRDTGETTLVEGPVDGSVAEGTGISAGHAASSIMISNALPAMISRNEATGLQVSNDSPPRIISGSSTVSPPTVQVGRGNRLTEIDHPPHFESVRLEIERAQRQTLIGAARAMAAGLGGVFIRDQSGNEYFPIGYVLHRANGQQRIDIKPAGSIRSAGELPIREMSPEDRLFLYFHLPRGIQLESYHIGRDFTQPVNLSIPR